MSDYGRERITVVELDMPYCQLEYGTTNAFGTCNASLTPAVGSPSVAATGDHKCFQTRSTCQDPAAYLPSTQIIRFSHPQRGLTQHYENVFPCLTPGEDNPSTTPGAINLGGMDRSLSALGVREAVDISMEDFRWNDHLFDKYRLERISGAAQAPTGSPPVSETYDPYERGTFWGKFLARNPYYANYRARVLQGFMGDALADMTTRSYIVDRITGPKNGKVQIALKDLFSLIEARKAVAPVASQGELAGNITIGATSATLSPAGIGNLEYAASGYLAIGDEVVSFTRSADALTIVRAQLGTTASAHDAEDLVQLVLAFDNELAHDIIYTLLTEYAEITAAEIPKTTWDALASAAGMVELYTARITTPTPVRDLIGELCEQAGGTVWHDPGTGLIQFIPLRPSAANVTVTDREWIIDQSLDIKLQDAKRVSRAMVYYSQKNPTIDLDDARNYRSRVITPDLDAESATQYGVPAIKEVFSRWIPQFGSSQASDTGARIVAMFRDPPLEASFRLHASRDGELRLAEPFLLETFEAQDDTGAEDSVLMVPVEIARGENELEIKAQGVKLYTDPNAAAAGTRTIQLNSVDMRNLNLRTVHDSIYSAPTGSEVITFVIPIGFSVGSTSTSLPAVRTGIWPTMATNPHLNVVVGARIQGKGGIGGSGSQAPNAPGGNGENGGPALLIEHTFDVTFWTVDGVDNIIGGGGGGGGGGDDSLVTPSGGGGGAGLDVGNGGLGGIPNGTAGQPGTIDDGGPPGFSLIPGGAGGGPGLNGSNGTSGNQSSGGTGGIGGVQFDGI